MTKDVESKRIIYTPLLFSHSVWNIEEESTARTKLV